MEGWGPDRHNGRGPAWPAPQISVVLVSSILQTLLPFKAPGNGQFLPTRKSQSAAQFIDNSKLSLLTRSPRFFQRGYYCKRMTRDAVDATRPQVRLGMAGYRA